MNALQLLVPRVIFLYADFDEIRLELFSLICSLNVGYNITYYNPQCMVVHL